ncbi:hypothetical protein H2248_010686 [Termitomyces sp. 'cryptogamus']|nr:hypothetical protein H2248_010686 [Termitomyces sp. 'cryptogamus']
MLGTNNSVMTKPCLVAYFTVATFALLTCANLLDKRATCIVPSGQSVSVDHVPAIKAAIQSCGNDGVIVIPAGYTYQIRCPLDFAGCINCEVQIEGTLKLSSDTAYWDGVRAAITVTNINSATIHSKTGSGVIDGNGVPF